MTSSFSSKKRSLLSLAVLVVLCVAIMAVSVAAMGCGKASLVGKWQDPSDNTISEFKADGTFVASDMPGAKVTYKVEGDKIIITAEGLGELTIQYKLDGDSLTVTDVESNETTILSRVK